MSDKEIKVHTDKSGKDHIDIYDGDPKEEHTSIHINWDSDTGKGTIVDTTSGEKETTNIGCYLTTACINHFQEFFDDNCEELTILRWFRDNYVIKDDVKHYYKVAPLIVETIEKEAKADLIYDYIYDNIVDYCVEEIKNGNYELAYQRYKDSVLLLEEKFLKNKKVKVLSLNN